MFFWGFWVFFDVFVVASMAMVIVPKKSKGITMTGCVAIFILSLRIVHCYCWFGFVWFLLALRLCLLLLGLVRLGRQSLRGR